MLAGSETPTIESSIGVGLAVVARYVRNMKGQIRVHSEPGKGTIFSIELPFEHAKENMVPNPPGALDIPPMVSKAMSDTSSARSVVITPDPPETPIDLSEITPRQADTNTSPSTNISSKMSSAFTSPLLYTASADPTNARYPFPQMEDFPQPAAAPPSPQSDSLVVLVAEDNPINSRLLMRRLTKLGHQVHLAQDGQECYDGFVKMPLQVDVILMDIQVCQ